VLHIYICDISRLRVKFLLDRKCIQSAAIIKTNQSTLLLEIIGVCCNNGAKDWYVVWKNRECLSGTVTTGHKTVDLGEQNAAGGEEYQERKGEVDEESPKTVDHLKLPVTKVCLPLS